MLIKVAYLLTDLLDHELYLCLGLRVLGQKGIVVVTNHNWILPGFKIGQQKVPRPKPGSSEFSQEVTLL